MICEWVDARVKKLNQYIEYAILFWSDTYSKNQCLLYNMRNPVDLCVSFHSIYIHFLCDVIMMASLNQFLWNIYTINLTKLPIFHQVQPKNVTDTHTDRRIKGENNYRETIMIKKLLQVTGAVKKITEELTLRVWICV